MFHLTALDCYFTHLFGMTLIEFRLNDDAIPIEIKVGKSGHFSFHSLSVTCSLPRRPALFHVSSLTCG